MRYWLTLLVLALLLVGGRADANNNYYNFINGAPSAGALSGTELLALTKGGTTTYQTTTGAIAGLPINLGTSASATNPQRSGQAGTGIFSTTTNTVSIASNGNDVADFNSGGTAALNLSTNNNSIILPTGTTAQRPTPTAGMIRYNSSTPGLEAYYSGAWNSLGTGSGSVSVTAATPDIVVNPSPGTGTFTVGSTNVINPQSGTSYTVLSSDMSKTVTQNNASASAYTLPQAGTTGFGSGVSFDFVNIGSGIATITPTTSTINGSSSLAFTTGQGGHVVSDGTNWIANLGKSTSSSQWTTSGSNINYTTGFVSIGTTAAPSNTPLNVSGSASGNLVAQITNTNASGNNGAELLATNDNGNTGGIQQLSSGFAGGQGNLTLFVGTSAIRFLTNNNNSTGGSGHISFVIGGFSNATTLDLAPGSPGTVAIGTTTAATNAELTVNGGIAVGSNLTFASTAPSVASGFGTSSTIGTGSTATSFDVNVGTGGSASSGVITMPAAAHKWSCQAHDETTNATNDTQVSASTTTSITLTNYVRTTGVAGAWPASDIVEVLCGAH